MSDLERYYTGIIQGKKEAPGNKTKKKRLTIGDVMREKHVTLQFRRNLKSLTLLILHFIEV